MNCAFIVILLPFVCTRKFCWESPGLVVVYNIMFYETHLLLLHNFTSSAVHELVFHPMFAPLNVL